MFRVKKTEINYGCVDISLQQTEYLLGCPDSVRSHICLDLTCQSLLIIVKLQTMNLMVHILTVGHRE